ncbi:ABC transporter ATP-binding protein [Ilumatobacter sp.]|uniref:ABC transporter ATP-binding protein n=1 Tax=Ilumatobacter sp. TaxID=1967498 RepID=UPI003B5210FA
MFGNPNNVRRRGARGDRASSSTTTSPAAGSRVPASVEIDDVSVSYGPGAVAVDSVSLTARAGTTTALLGPSGCGKTSLLRAIAGLERPVSGSVRVAGREVSGPGTWVRPEHRLVGMVFQDGALFPHLSVRDNVAFGLRSSPVGDDPRRRVDELLALVDLGGLGDRLPETLSGGQQQRVALARSLAPNPAVLLLDEPFSALDAGLRTQVRAEVATILRDVGVTSIFVTHDQDEAFVLGDRVAVMRDGRVEQVAAPDELYRAPVNPWVARFVGEANLVPGVAGVDAGRVDTPLGRITISSLRAGATVEGESMSVLVRPEQVAVLDGDTAEITAVEYYGHDVRYEVRLDDGSTLAARAHPDRLRSRGDRVAVAFDGTAATTVFPS